MVQHGTHTATLCFLPNPLILTENVYKDYYPDFFQQAGFKSIGQYLTQLDRSLLFDQNKKEKVNNFLAPLNLKYRNINLDDYGNELKKNIRVQHGIL